MLYALVSKYQKILELVKTHYQEEKDGINHAFAIDFSDLYIYLNPIQVEKTDLDNIGSTYYMFDSKLKNHHYYLLPPAAWEILSDLDKKCKQLKKTDFSSLMKENKNIQKLYNLIKSTDKFRPEVFAEKIMQLYQETGGLSEILVLASQNKLDKRLRQNSIKLNEMVHNKTIQSIDAIVDNVEKVEYDKNIYRSVLSELTYGRPLCTINNNIDALNLALTYGLTNKSLTDTNKEANIFYRIASHSKWPSKAFSAVTYDKKYIACCPQFVSALILKENGNIKLPDHFLDENINRLERIKNFYRYPNRENLLNETVFKEIRGYSSDLADFMQQIHQPLIEPLIKINSGDIEYHNTETFETLSMLFNDRKMYEKIAYEASDLISEELKNTHKLLYSFVNENQAHFLTPEMIKMLEGIG